MYFDYIGLPFPLWGTVCWVRLLQNKFHLAGRAKLSSCSQAPEPALPLHLQLFPVCLLTNQERQKGRCRLSELRYTRCKCIAYYDMIDCVQLLPTLLFITPISWPESKWGANSRRSWQILKPGDPYKAQLHTLTSLLNPLCQNMIGQCNNPPHSPLICVPIL